MQIDSSDTSSHHGVGRLLERWLVPLLLLLFCAGAIWLSLGFDRMPPILKRGIQPADFPQYLCAAMIALTLLMMWIDPIEVSAPLGSKPIGSLILMLVLFPLLTLVDFFLALAIFAGVLAAYWGERRPRHLALVAFVVPVSVFFLFDLVFEIRFPKGLLTNLWYG